MQYTSNNIRLSQLTPLTQTKYELGRKFVYDLIIRQTHLIRIYLEANFHPHRPSGLRVYEVMKPTLLNLHEW